MKQNRSKMGDERQDQEVGENRVRSPQHRVQHDPVPTASYIGADSPLKLRIAISPYRFDRKGLPDADSAAP